MDNQPDDNPDTVRIVPLNAAGTVMVNQASQAASMILDMASYIKGPGLESFTAWMQQRYPDARQEHIKANMTSLIRNLSRTLFEVIQ